MDPYDQNEHYLMDSFDNVHPSSNYFMSLDWASGPIYSAGPNIPIVTKYILFFFLLKKKNYKFILSKLVIA